MNGKCRLQKPSNAVSELSSSRDAWGIKPTICVWNDELSSLLKLSDTYDQTGDFGPFS
jgi:hypothetical protein